MGVWSSLGAWFSLGPVGGGGVPLLTHVLPGRGLPALRPARDWPAQAALLVRGVGLHHLALLRGDDVLLLAGLLPRRRPGEELPRRGAAQRRRPVTPQAHGPAHIRTWGGGANVLHL